VFLAGCPTNADGDAAGGAEVATNVLAVSSAGALLLTCTDALAFTGATPDDEAAAPNGLAA
jgi:hypothetical protein